jgi:glycosyltransferase involved in cell wall biosynthesis
MANNCVVLSSNCPNGPKEIIQNKNGLLFESNSEKDFILKFNLLLKLSESEKKEFQINAKKKIKNFSIFYHFKQLQKILSNY